MQNNIKQGAIRIPNSTNGYNTFIYSMKRFDEPSEYGIDGGRISKLSLRDKDSGQFVVNYDRGWDIKPDTKEADTALKILMMNHN